MRADTRSPSSTSKSGNQQSAYSLVTRTATKPTNMEEKPRTSMALALAVVLVVATTMGMMDLVSGAQGICNMTTDELMACKPCISTVKPVEKPADACCTALAHADLPCLCAYKNSGVLPYLGIDPNLAMKLPAKCSVAAPEQCK